MEDSTLYLSRKENNFLVIVTIFSPAVLMTKAFRPKREKNLLRTTYRVLSLRSLTNFFLVKEKTLPLTLRTSLPERSVTVDAPPKDIHLFLIANSIKNLQISFYFILYNTPPFFSRFFSQKLFSARESKKSGKTSPAAGRKNFFSPAFVC